MNKVEAAVLGAKQNEADALSNAELKLSVDERAELILSRVTESAHLYADLYNVNAAAFLAALKASL
jgi:hypothetical protein